MKRFALVIVALLVTAPAFAQIPQLTQGVQYKLAFSPTTTVPPAGVVYDHRVYFDGAMQNIPAGTALVNGEIQVNLPLWPVGTHNIRFSSIPRFTNGTALTTCQNTATPPVTVPCETFGTPDPFQVQVVAAPVPVPAPLPPGPIRIIIPATIGQGNTVTIGSPITIEQVQPAAKSRTTAKPAPKKKQAEKEE